MRVVYQPNCCSIEKENQKLAYKWLKKTISHSQESSIPTTFIPEKGDEN